MVSSFVTQRGSHAKYKNVTGRIAIKDWLGAAPDALPLGGEKLAAGKSFNASVRGGVLLLQVFRIIKDDVSVAIPGP